MVDNRAVSVADIAVVVEEVPDAVRLRPSWFLICDERCCHLYALRGALLYAIVPLHGLIFTTPNPTR